METKLDIRDIILTDINGSVAPLRGIEELKNIIKIERRKKIINLLDI